MRIWLIFAPSIFLVLAVLAYWGFQSRVLEEPAPGRDYDLILALSWQPAFCELRSRLPECRSQHSGRFDAQAFSLHGLWPAKRNRSFCGVSQQVRQLDQARRWRDLPKLELADELRQRLKTRMPGYRSHLHRHEWFKHGTCLAGMTPESYFRTALALQEAFNRSTLPELFSRNLDKEISTREIRDQVTRAFGSGAGERVQVSCRRDATRRLILELTISLSGAVDGTIDTPAALGRLMTNAKPVKPGCPGGTIDRANR